MKKVVLFLVAFSILCGCGTTPSPEATMTSSSQSAYTDDELFLQEAYWYLQSDEKELFSWEDGVVQEDYCSDHSHTVIGPSGETDIKGRFLTRVCYTYTHENELNSAIRLYFDGDEFIGTDTGVDMENRECFASTPNPYWDGDISYWLFLDSPETDMDTTYSITCVLRNNSDIPRQFSAFSPSVMYVELFQDGISKGGGIDSSAQYFTLEPGETFIESYTLDWENYQNLTPGSCTVMTYVKLQQYDTATEPFNFSLYHTATFTITS
jgi:hypothetical protein